MTMTPRNLGVRFGKLTQTSATFVFFSRSNTDVSLTVDGTTYSGITMSAVGADRATNDDAGTTTFGYAGSQAVTFSSGFTARNWSATQGANTETGTITPAPGNVNSFTIGLITCQRSFVKNDKTKYAPSADKFLNYYRQNGRFPLVSIVHSDDLYYADGANSDGTIPATADPNGKKLEATSGAQATRKAYDFAMYYGSMFGIAGPITDTTIEYLCTGLLSYSKELYNNVAFMPQWGDHEFMNNIGWMNTDSNGQLLSSVPNPYHATAGGYDGKGLLTYNAIFAPLQGTSAQSADTDSNHWYVDFGPVRIVAMDPITKAVPNYPSDMTTLYGTNQCNDVLNILNVRKPFKFVVGPYFSRATTNADAVNTAVNGSTVKYWQNKMPAEYNRLYVNSGQTPKSIMDNNETNGVLGTTVVFATDWHQGLSLYQQAAAGGGVVAEGFHIVALCGAVQHGGGSDETRIFNSAAFASDSMEYFGGGMTSSPMPKAYKSCCTLAEFDMGARTPTLTIRTYDLMQAATANDPDNVGTMINRIHLTYGNDITDDEGNIWACIYERKFVHYNGNYGHTADAVTWEQAGVGTGSKL